MFRKRRYILADRGLIKKYKTQDLADFSLHALQLHFTSKHLSAVIVTRGETSHDKPLPNVPFKSEE